jgi:hypothetical protein
VTKAKASQHQTTAQVLARRQGFQHRPLFELVALDLLPRARIFRLDRAGRPAGLSARPKARARSAGHSSGLVLDDEQHFIVWCGGSTQRLLRGSRLIELQVA